MATPSRQIATTTVWSALCDEARQASARERPLAGLLTDAILRHGSLGEALGAQLARKLESPEMPALTLRAVLAEAYAADPDLVQAAADDLRAVLDRDPACAGFVKPFLFYKGFLALQTHRAAAWFWRQGRETLARYLQSRCSELLHVDIRPAAVIGRGAFIDHGTGVVIGETAVIGDDVTILQHVTLGGTGIGSGERHPRIGRGVLLSAGARLLGPVTVGDHAKIAANSLVLIDVPAGCTAVGIPARLVNCPPAFRAGRGRRPGSASPPGR